MSEIEANIKNLAQTMLSNNVTRIAATLVRPATAALSHLPFAPSSVSPGYSSINPVINTPNQSKSFKIVANCRYYVGIDGIEYAAFSEIGGLQIETETMDFIEGGVNDRVMRLPVRSRVGNLILKRGVTSGNELLNWHLRIVQGYLDLKNVTITIYETSGKVLMRFELLQAYPVKWAGPQFLGTGDAVAVETLELAHAGFLNLGS